MSERRIYTDEEIANINRIDACLTEIRHLMKLIPKAQITALRNECNEMYKTYLGEEYINLQEKNYGRLIRIIDKCLWNLTKYATKHTTEQISQLRKDAQNLYENYITANTIKRSVTA